jgi:hypothetical protein
MLLSGCSKDTAQQEVDFAQDDFAFYMGDVENSLGGLVMGIGTAEEELMYDNDNTPYLDGVEYSTKKVYSTLSDETEPAAMHDIIYYMSYRGGRMPVTTVKGITTTGYEYANNDNCSKAGDVLKAYGIDSKNEEYIADKTDEDNYNIVLHFNKDTTIDENEMTELETDENGTFIQPEEKKIITRVVSPTGTDLSSVDCRYTLRFMIRDGYVHGIDILDNGVQ